MATVYLAPAPTGDDSRTYVQAQNSATPWATVAKVNSSAASGDTVSMAAGTYAAESVDFQKSFTFTGAALANGVPTTLINYAGGEKRHRLYVSTSLTLKYQKIKFYGFDQTTLSNFAFYIATSSTLTFEDCWFAGTVMGYFVSSLVSIESSGSACALNFTRCAFDDLKSHTQTAGYSGMVVGNNPLTIAVNNCIFSFRETGASLYMPSLWYANSVTHTVTLKNTIIDCAAGTALKWEDGAGGGSTSETVSYSCLHNLTGSVPTGTGVITTDPKLIDPTNGNFYLRPDSPCIDTGL